MKAEQYQRPSESDLPAALAKEMGFERIIFDPANYGPRPLLVGHSWQKDGESLGADGDFKPLTDRNHSRLAVERCAELGLMHFEDSGFHGENQEFFEKNFVDILLIELSESIDIEWQHSQVALLLRAAPAQESYAAHRVLWEHNHRQQETP